MSRIMNTVLEFLNIIISWPFVILVIFLLLFGPIRSFILSLEKRGAEIPTPLGAFKVLPPENVGEITPELAKESPKRAIEALLKRPREIPAGLTEIFVGLETISRGSGFVASKSGYVISDTNVLGEAREVFVRMSREDHLRHAKVLAKSPDTFLALLQLPEGAYSALEFASFVSIGERVYKLSLKSGIAVGIIQAIGEAHIEVHGPRRLMVLSDVLTTSALSQPGDSGSPLLNEQGKVVGVIVAGSPTMSVAIPARRILSEFPQIAP